MLDWWKKLKMRQQVSSLCCANVLSPLSCWSLSHKCEEHNYLNCGFSGKNGSMLQWVPHHCRVEWVCSFESLSFMNTQMDFFPPWNECVFIFMLYVYVFPVSEIKWESSLPRDRLAFLFCFRFQLSYNLIMHLCIEWLLPLEENK